MLYWKFCVVICNRGRDTYTLIDFSLLLSSSCRWAQMTFPSSFPLVKLAGTSYYFSLDLRLIRKYSHTIQHPHKLWSIGYSHLSIYLLTWTKHSNFRLPTLQNTVSCYTGWQKWKENEKLDAKFWLRLNHLAPSLVKIFHCRH